MWLSNSLSSCKPFRSVDCRASLGLSNVAIRSATVRVHVIGSMTAAFDVGYCNDLRGVDGGNACGFHLSAMMSRS
jgi:hypothetical protein